MRRMGRRPAMQGEGGSTATCRAAVLFALALLHLPALVPAPAPLPTDVFISSCPRIPDSPSTEFKLWSNPMTWAPLGIAGIPGVGSLLGSNITIPCGMTVLLDVASLNLTMLYVQGFLKVYDPPIPTSYSVYAALVLVEGQLTVGSSTNQFRSQITFTLMPNPNKRQNWAASNVYPADPANPRIIGHKAFVVMGGQVDLHGMPSGPDTPSWAKLNANLRKGDKQLILDRDVSASWPIGSRIALSSTDYDPQFTDLFTISGYGVDPRGTVVLLNNTAQYNHYGDPRGIPDGFGGYLDERAEVALLSRNIVITGLDEQNTPYLLEGGHFIIFMTPVAQYIEGVQFLLMGQQGSLGRYSIHFHACGDTNGQSLVRKNAIVNSKQRCVVVHATHNLTVEGNVAYNTIGHCFMLEEGSEQNNSFIGNLGFLQRPPVKLISSDESDNTPSTFWITNMRNNFVGNVAAGSIGNGFWTELRMSVRGMSLLIPALATIVPRDTPFGTYTNNTAHSNKQLGWQFYNVNGGVQPKVFWDTKQTKLSEWQWPASSGTVYNLFVYKHNVGVFLHNSQRVFLANFTAADCDIGANLVGNYGSGVLGGRFLALSNNLGNPKNCTTAKSWMMECVPATGCSLTTDPSTWRARSNVHWLSPMLGLHVSSPKTVADAGAIYNLTDLRFSGYEQQCGRMSAGIGTGLYGEMNFWSASQGVLRLSRSSPNMPLYWLANENFTWPNNGALGLQGVQKNYAVWDMDGSLVGGSGGYLVANYPGLAPPPSLATCKPLPQQNALSCPGTCYRSFRFDYFEPGFSNATGIRTRFNSSYLIVRRVDDNSVRTFDGNLNDFRAWADRRAYWVNVYAPATYEVSIGMPLNGQSKFWPASIWIYPQDFGGCGADVTFRFAPLPANQWTITTSDVGFWSPCAGTSSTSGSQSWPVQIQYVCGSGAVQALQLTIKSSISTSTVPVIFTSGKPALPCGQPPVCGLHTSSDRYSYNTSGWDLRTPAPGYMGYSVPTFDDSKWPVGQAIIGNNKLARTTTPVNNATNGFTFFYRKSFTISNSGCYSAFYLDFIPLMGLLVYLNNAEVFRWSLPTGTITNTTLGTVASTYVPNPLFLTVLVNFSSANASLVEGRNFLAFETHSPMKTTYSPYFDTRFALASRYDGCQGPAVRPEVCDGLDNNFDGLVDADPLTGKLLTRPCYTPCGSGIETCINGAYQNCTALQTLPESCNGKDDDCDGLVDNGPAGSQLDCATGSVCFQGQCLPQTPLTVPQVLINSSTPGWFYQDQGWAWQKNPQWLMGQLSGSTFKTSSAPFGTSSYAGPISTILAPRSTANVYTFYVRSFQLSLDEAASTYSLQARVKRDNAAVVWSNGVEIMRSNYPATWQPSSNNSTFPITAGTSTAIYWPSLPLRRLGVAGGTALNGTNWLAAQVGNTRYSPATWFDLELIRHVTVSCSTLPGSPTSCVRNPPTDTIFFSWGSVWKYIDCNYSLPPSSWKLPSFGDSYWPSGAGALGVSAQMTTLRMNRTARVTYYFRKTFLSQDAACFYNLNVQLRAQDGAVVYFNGVEAYRFQMPTSTILPTTYSLQPTTDRANFTLSTGWLVPGLNTVAVELHVAEKTAPRWTFDMVLSGQREAVNCNPQPE